MKGIPQNVHFSFRAIGYAKTPFPTKRGVPRQGLLAPSAKALVTLTSMQGTSLEGLENYSHVWLFFVFSRNSNNDKVDAWRTTQDSLESRRGAGNRVYTFPSKVRPPRLLGKKTGLFSTRSPHRPNPIGLTLAKVHDVDAKNGTLLVSSVDLCDGTPIVDLKPYVPADRPNDAFYPDWVAPANEKDAVPLTADAYSRVVVAEGVRAAAAEAFTIVAERKESTGLYETSDEVVGALKEILTLDIRGRTQNRGGLSSEGGDQHTMVLDGIFFSFDFMQDEIRITGAVPQTREQKNSKNRKSTFDIEPSTKKVKRWYHETVLDVSTKNPVAGISEAKLRLLNAKTSDDGDDE